ncbi:MAG TPA: SGNH/GDSL hydrolase family protein [Bacteroidales bacterium]|nr:SGNH/GDSL hydrolase family protein [Bacteroidales bacterium]
MKINLTFSFFFILVITAVSCQHTKQTWVGTWSCAPQLVELHNMPPEPGLTNSTLRQVVRVSIGGDSVRVRFSNEFSSSPVTIRKANIALSAGGSKIDASTITMLTFNNNQEVTMEPGMAVTSDPVAFRIKPRTDIAITIFFGTTSPDVTGHPGSRTTSYLISGDHTSMPELSDAATADRWYIINGIDVKASDKAASIVVIGNSITDGRGSGTNKQNRWPDILAERLIQNPATSNVAVLNQGIGGNCVLRPCLGPSALDRFEKDVLRQHGVHWLIILEGINDIGQAPDSIAAISIADNLITAYKQMTEKAHSSGIKVYGATILPFKGSFYYTNFREAARRKVNEWIRQNNYFDAIIDFDMIMRNPEDTLSLLPETHTGDFLHPNEKGYLIMGESIDLKLFIK